MITKLQWLADSIKLESAFRAVDEVTFTDQPILFGNS